MGRILAVLLGGLLLAATLSATGGALAHEPHVCPDGFPDAPVIAKHLRQADVAARQYSLAQLTAAGADLFNAQFNMCDGQGRPASTGTGAAREPGEHPAFIRTSAPDSSSCAGCHNAPRSGGSGGFVANVFVLAQAMNPVTESVSGEFSNERNTLGMFGAGAIEMLAREMTTDLLTLAAQVPDGVHTLTTKGVDFTVEKQAGIVVSAGGVDADLIVKPFHQAGVVRSIREFTVNAMNHHHGMQAEERFYLNPGADCMADPRDCDADGVTNELTVGDITAATIYQAALAVPGRLLPADPTARAEIDHGEQVFADVGCASCHVPQLTLSSRTFSEPYDRNPAGTFSDTSLSVAFDMTTEGEWPRLEAAPDGGAVVRAYTDLKRHSLCDPVDQVDAIRVFCNERLAQGRDDHDGHPGAEYFLTRKLWDVGSSAPYGHRGDLPTITEAILAHGGEARATRDAFNAQPFEDQVALVKFLKTLQVLPAGSPPIVVAGR